MMENRYKVTVFLDVVVTDSHESILEAIKDAIVEAVELDDRGEQELEFDTIEI
jgi:hypothetical protein